MRQLVEVAANCYETFIYIAANHNNIHLKVLYKDKDPTIIGRNPNSQITPVGRKISQSGRVSGSDGAPLTLSSAEPDNFSLRLGDRQMTIVLATFFPFSNVNFNK